MSVNYYSSTKYEINEYCSDLYVDSKYYVRDLLKITLLIIQIEKFPRNIISDSLLHARISFVHYLKR